MSQELDFRFSIQDTNFSTKLNSFNKGLKALDEQVKQASADVVKQGKDLDSLSKKYSALEKSLNGAKEKVKMYVDQIDKQNKAINDTKSKLDDLKKKKETLNKAYEQSVKAVGKEAEETQKIVAEQEKLDKQIKATEKSLTSKEKTLHNYTLELEKSKTNVKELEVQLSGCSKELEKQTNNFIKASEKLDKFADKCHKVGGKIDDFSDKVLKISTAFVGVGTAVGKMQMDFEDSLAQVSTLLSDTTDLDRFGDKVIELSNKTGIAVGDMASSIYDALSSGVDESGVLDFVERANKLATAGFTSIGNATDVLTSTLNAYGLELSEVSHISDVFIKAQDLGKLTIEELSSSVGKAIPTFASNNVSVEELSASLALMTSKGISCSESVTYVNSMVNELAKSGSKSDEALKELAGKGFKDLMNEGKNLSDVLGLLSEYAEANSLSLSDMFGSAEASKSALSLMSNEGKEYVDVLNQMNGALGTTDKNFEKVNNTSGKDLQRSINELKNSFLNLGDNLVPIIGKISDGIKKLADMIGNLSDEQIESIIDFGKWTLILGGTTKALGGVVSGVGTLSKVFSGVSKGVGTLTKSMNTISTTSKATTTATKGLSTALKGGLATSIGSVSSVVLPLTVAIAGVGTAMYAVHEAQDVLKSSVAKSKEEYSGMEKVMAKLMGVQLKSREELEKQGVVYKEFNKNISKDFQSAVEEMRGDIADFNFELASVNLDGVFTQEEADSLTSRVSGAVDSAIQTINSKQSEMQQSLTNLLNEDGIISEKEANLIQWWERRGDTEIAEVTKLQEEIAEIERNAIGGELTPEDEENIRKKLERIHQIKLEAMAENNDELLYAQKEFELQVSSMSAEEASKRLVKIKEESDKKVTQKQVEFEILKTQLMKGYDSLSEEDQKYVDETIALAEQGVNDTIAKEDERWQEMLKTATEGNEDILDCINIFNGEMLTEEEIKMQKLLDNYTKQYDGMNNITETGMYKMYNKVTDSWDDVYVSVDTATGKIKGALTMSATEYGIYAGDVQAYDKETEKSLIELAGEMEKDWKKISNATVTASGEMVDANGKVIGKLEEIETQADGTKTAIVDLNGNKINVKINENGSISFLDSVIQKLNRIGQGASASVNVRSGQNLMYAVGSANVPEDTLATINEKGWELVNTPNNTTAFALGRSLQGDIAYIPQGTKISTNLTSTQQMQQAVKNEVNNQVTKQNTELTKALNNISKAVDNLNNINNTNIDVNDIIDSIVIDNILNLTIDGKQLSSALAPYLDKATSQYNKARRK